MTEADAAAVYEAGWGDDVLRLFCGALAIGHENESTESLRAYFTASFGLKSDEHLFNFSTVQFWTDGIRQMTGYTSGIE
jgi:hypothetical protein